VSCSTVGHGARGASKNTAPLLRLHSKQVRPASTDKPLQEVAERTELVAVAHHVAHVLEAAAAEAACGRSCRLAVQTPLRGGGRLVRPAGAALSCSVGLCSMRLSGCYACHCLLAECRRNELKRKSIIQQ
jgi:hypothetical protein